LSANTGDSNLLIPGNEFMARNIRSLISRLSLRLSSDWMKVCPYWVIAETTPAPPRIPASRST